MARVLEFIYSCLFILVGVSCLAIAIIHPETDCGLNGKPPLRQWLYASGISYILISIIFLCSAIYFQCAVRRNWDHQTATANTIVVIIATYMIAWTIVGGVSLWGNGFDCEFGNPTIWKMGLGAVGISTGLTAFLLIHCIVS